MSSQQDMATPGPLELIESARTKYTLAMARVRRGPPELALLSVHGSLEDVLRAHGLRLRLPAAYEPFPQLLEALTAVEQLPLSAAEAEGIRRMHRLRARVAHGEAIAVAAETLDAYHRLAARLLPRYGVTVVPPSLPEEAADPRAAGAPPARRGDTMAIVRSDTPETRRRGDTAVLDRNLAAGGPRRERTVYPDDRPARYAGRVLPSAATRDLPLAREMLRARPRRGWGDQLEDAWEGAGRYLLPAVIVISIFLVGLVISTSLGQLRGQPAVPTAAVAFTPLPVPTLGPGDGLGAGAPLAPTALPADPAAPPPAPGELAVGVTAYVRADAGALNVRERPGLAEDNPIQVTLAPGTAVQVVGGPEPADGMTWWRLSAAGVEGWSAGDWLEVR
ncbi:MAG TPA: SH3 domain-containing protein [Chloroflexaceae bacterium]|nr:SH3 domain-containing protein [Chloroflexaceae bacterium]